MPPNPSAQLRDERLRAPTEVTELRVHNITRALDTYLGLGYDAVSVADGRAVLRNGAENRTIVLRTTSPHRSGG